MGGWNDAIGPVGGALLLTAGVYQGLSEVAKSVSGFQPAANQLAASSSRLVDSSELWRADAQRVHADALRAYSEPWVARLNPFRRFPPPHAAAAAAAKLR